MVKGGGRAREITGMISVGCEGREGRVCKLNKLVWVQEPGQEVGRWVSH